MTPAIVTQADMAILSMLRCTPPLERKLERAIVVSSEAVPPDVATMNSQVCYTDETEGVTRIVALVYGPVAPGTREVACVMEPLGAALLGLSSGQTVEREFPDGRVHRIRLVEVLYQPERERARRAAARASLPE